MTDKIDTSTAAIAALMDGVTPGPWEQDGPISSKIVWAGPDVRVCFMTSDGPASKNARFIAASRELVPALTDERDAAVARAERSEARVAELESEVERMREASQMAGASLGEEIADLRNGAVCAAVKPLKWEPSIIGKPWHSAQAPWGFYYAQWDDEIGAWFASLEMGEVEAPIILQPSDVETIDAAKAAAQADYERRILSTLTLRSDAELRAEAVSATWSAAIKAETAWSPETNSTPWCLLTVEQMRAFEASTGQMMRLRQDGEWHPHNGNGVGIVSDTYRIRKGGAQ